MKNSVSDNESKRCSRLLTAQVLFVVFIFSFLGVSCSSESLSDGKIAPPTFPVLSTASTTQNPTPSYSSVPTQSVTAPPTAEPGLPDCLGIYIPKDGQRILIDSFSSKWISGNDIDCFEAITSLEKTHNGLFADIWKLCWNSFPNNTNVKIGYSLEIFLRSGDSAKYDIKSPKDTLQHKDFVEAYLYDDIHVDGWYSHLEESDINSDTVITSIKLTATEKQNEIDKIKLTAYLYTQDLPERAIAHSTIDIFNEQNA